MDKLSDLDLALIKIAIMSHIEYSGLSDGSIRLQEIEDLYRRVCAECTRRDPKRENDDGFYVAASDAAA